jgi:ubiquinone/menaquinone biosynthesis C-methylase UbiE
MHKHYKTEIRIQGGELSKDQISPRKVYNKLNTQHLVSFDDFKRYVSSQNTMIAKYFPPRKRIEISNAIYIIKKRFHRYESPESNDQMITLYNSDTVNRNRLNEMLSYFVGPMWAKIMMTMIEHKKSDSEILSLIKTHYQHADSMHSKIYRMAKLCDFIFRNITISKSTKLLDIGVGNGAKTLQMKELLRCQVYGADLASWGPYNKNRNLKFPYKQIQLKPYHIPYDDGMFDCITLILVLHHATDIIAVINECKRLLKQNGIVVIVEHDVWSDEMNMIVDLQHRIYATIFDESDSYYATYYNCFEWDVLFNKCGMTPICVSSLTDDITNFQRYDAQFISIYRKS